MPKVQDKEKLLKATKEKQLPSELSKDHRLIFQRKFAGQREWQELFKVIKNKDLQPRLLYPAKLSFRIEG